MSRREMFSSSNHGGLWPAGRPSFCTTLYNFVTPSPEALKHIEANELVKIFDQYRGLISLLSLPISLALAQRIYIYNSTKINWRK